MQWASCSFIAAFFAVVGICNGRPTGESKTSVQCRRLWSGSTRVSSEGSEQHLSFDFPLDVDDWFFVLHFRFPVLEVELDSHDDYHKYVYDYGDENRNVIVSPHICCKKAKRGDLFGAVVRVARGMPPPRFINATLFVATNQGSFLKFNLCDPEAQGQRYQLTTSDNVEDAVEETSTRYADEETVDESELNANATDANYEAPEKLNIKNNRRQSTVGQQHQSDEVGDDLLTIVDQASKMHLYSPDVHEEVLVGRSTTKRSVPSSPPATQMVEEELDAETTPSPVSSDQDIDLVLPLPLTPTQQVLSSSFDNSSGLGMNSSDFFSGNESKEKTPEKATLENDEYAAQEEQGGILIKGPFRENGTESDGGHEAGDKEVETGSPNKPTNGKLHPSLHQGNSAAEKLSETNRPILVDDSYLAVRPETASASDILLPDKEVSLTNEQGKAADQSSQLNVTSLLNVTQDDAEDILDVSDQHGTIGSPGYVDEGIEPEPSNMEVESMDEQDYSDEHTSQDTGEHLIGSTFQDAKKNNTEPISKISIQNVTHGMDEESTVAHSNVHLADNLTAVQAKNSSSLGKKDDALNSSQKNTSIPTKIKLQVGKNVTTLEESMSLGNDSANGSMDDSGPEDQGTDMGIQANSSLSVLEDTGNAGGDKSPEKYGSLFNDSSAPTEDQDEELFASEDSIASSSQNDEDETTFSPTKVIPNDKRRNQTEFNKSSNQGKPSEENLAVFTSNTTEDDLLTPISAAPVGTNLTKPAMNKTKSNPSQQHPTFDLEEIDRTSYSDLEADSSSLPPQKEPFKREDQPIKASNTVHLYLNTTGKVNDTESKVHSTGVKHEIISHSNDYGEEESEESEEHSTGVKHDISSHEREKVWLTESEEHPTGIEPEIISHFNDHGDHEEDWDQDLPENGPVVNITSSGLHNFTDDLGNSEEQVVKTNGTSLISEDDDIPVVPAGNFHLNGSKNEKMQHMNHQGHEWDDELSSVNSEDHHVDHEDPAGHVMHANSSSHSFHGHGQIPAANGSEVVEEQDYETLGALGAIGHVKPPSVLSNLTLTNSTSVTGIHDDESPVVGFTLDEHQNGTIDSLEPLAPDTEETTAGLISFELPGVQQQGHDEVEKTHHGIHEHEEDASNVSSGSGGSSVYKPVKPNQDEEGLETASHAPESEFSGQYHGIPVDVAYDDLNDYNNGQQGSDPDAYSHETHDYREDVLPEDARPVGGAELVEEEVDDAEDEHELEKNTQNPTEVEVDSAVTNTTESVEKSGMNSTEVSSTASTTSSPDATEVYLDDTAEKAQILPGIHGHEGAKEPGEDYGEQPFVDDEMPGDANETSHLHGHHHHSNFSEGHFNGSVSEGHEHESAITQEGESSHDHGHDENPDEDHEDEVSSDHHEKDEASIESHLHEETSSGDHKHQDTAIELHEHEHDYVANKETSSGDHDLQDTSTEPQKHDDASTEDDEHEDSFVGDREEDDATTEDHDHGAAGHDHEHKHENGTTGGLEHGGASGQGQSQEHGGASADDHGHEDGTTEDHEHQDTSSDDHHHEHGSFHDHGSDTSDHQQHDDEEREHEDSDEDHTTDSLHNHGDLLPGVHRPNPADTSTLKGITEKIPGLTNAPGEGRKASKVQVEPPGNRSNSASSIKPGLAAIFALISAAYIFIRL